MRTVFHGSEFVIEKPKYCGGRPYNDYGYGFYCTESESMAKEWAVTMEHDGYANRYELDDEALSILYLNRDYSILTWLAMLLKHRTFSYDSPLAKEGARYLFEHFSVDAEKYDLIIGYRADDSYFSFAQDFISGAISVEQLSRAMYLGELGMQIVLKSREAFERLHFSGAKKALRRDWLDQKMLRDLKARSAYLNSDRMRYQRGELYITTILEEEIRDGDPRLQ